MQLKQVKQYHQSMRNKRANMTFMGWFLPNSTELRIKGWVVSGYNGEDSHKLFSNKKLAIEFINITKCKK